MHNSLSTHPRRRRQDHRFRPVLEPLESRCTPSVVNWDGNTDQDGDGIHWGDPLNWENDALPGASDDAVIGQLFQGNTIIAGSASLNRIESRANLEWGAC